MKAQEIDQQIRWSDRNDGPGILLNLYTDGLITLPQVRARIADVWSSAEFPGRVMPVESWVGAFRMVGFVADTVCEGQGDWKVLRKAGAARRPAEPVRLYRGANADASHGLSWTTDRKRAEWFAGRFPHLGAVIWTAVAQPGALLAQCDSRGEYEFVTDPRMLEIELAA